IVAAAEVGSRATGPGDRWSDIDLTFGVAAGVTIAEILAAWTPEIEREFAAVPLFDLPYQSSVYRGFLFPRLLQGDLSFTPVQEFGALGPKFKLLFGEAVTRSAPPSPTAAYRFGLAVHHALRARICIERERFWQAEYWISSLRDEALALACLKRGLVAGHPPGYHALPDQGRAARGGGGGARGRARGLVRGGRADAGPGGGDPGAARGERRGARSGGESGSAAEGAGERSLIPQPYQPLQAL